MYKQRFVSFLNTRVRVEQIVTAMYNISRRARANRASGKLPERFQYPASWLSIFLREIGKIEENSASRERFRSHDLD